MAFAEIAHLGSGDQERQRRGSPLNSECDLSEKSSLVSLAPSSFPSGAGDILAEWIGSSVRSRHRSQNNDSISNT